MGTPEDVATEKHFTPPTLTESLRSDLDMEPTCDAEAQAMKDTLMSIKAILKRWLSTVGLPETMDAEETRRLLITLVDEP